MSSWSNGHSLAPFVVVVGLGLTIPTVVVFGTEGNRVVVTRGIVVASGVVVVEVVVVGLIFSSTIATQPGSIW
jgi:hypothetical protein